MANEKRKIDSATPEQWAEIDRVREKWINMQTVQSSDALIRETVNEMWESMKLPRPKILICDSPVQAIKYSAYLAALSPNKVATSGTRPTVKSPVELIDNLTMSICEILDDCKNSSEPGLSTRLKKMRGSDVKAALEAVSEIAYQDAYNEARKESNWYLSIWWNAWAGWYEGATILGVEFDKNTYDLFLKWNHHVTFLAFFEDFVVVSRRPTVVKWLDNRLHCEDGPAVAYKDGWSMFALNGFRVNEQIVMRPETQTISQIDNETDNDIRAIRMERYGIDNYLVETGAVVIDETHNDIEGTHEALLRAKDGRVYLWPTCPSGRICPPLGVPRDMQNCEAARNWLAGTVPGRTIART